MQQVPLGGILLGHVLYGSESLVFPLLLGYLLFDFVESFEGFFVRWDGFELDGRSLPLRLAILFLPGTVLPCIGSPSW